MGELAQDLVMLINRIFPPGTARQLSLSLWLFRIICNKLAKVEMQWKSNLNQGRETHWTWRNRA